MSAEEIAAKSVAVFTQVETLEEFKRAKNILAYASLKTEVQTLDFLQRWSKEKNIFLPIVCGDELRIGALRHCEERGTSNAAISRFEKQDCFAKPARNDAAFGEANSWTTLRKGTFGILEPENALPEIPPLDLAIIPGLAFDRENNRLGRGKGYYDKLLNTHSLYKVGACFGCQLFDEIPHEAFDVKMDRVVFS